MQFSSFTIPPRRNLCPGHQKPSGRHGHPRAHKHARTHTHSHTPRTSFLKGGLTDDVVSTSSKFSTQLFFRFVFRFQHLSRRMFRIATGGRAPGPERRRRTHGQTMDRNSHSTDLKLSRNCCCCRLTVS
uniref:(northern house mosquito) hypothetical protein n=1 Tax=Culex pipiens TaxID=7175 RepID=A0A8D8FB04_CULPI